MIRHINVQNVKEYHKETVDKVKNWNLLIGGYLDNLREYRVEADYMLNHPIDKTKYEEALEIKNRIFSHLENLGI